jgi:hypothetical protein
MFISKTKLLACLQIKLTQQTSLFIQQFKIKEMYKLTFLSIAVFCGLSLHLFGQTIYVDAVKGNDNAKGTAIAPFLSLEKAVTTANEFTGNEPVTIKLTPGLYVLQRKLTIKTAKDGDMQKFTIEAVNMPDDADWQPVKTPVIQSVSTNNSDVQFTHCVGFLVDKNNVSFKGLKFVGNASPDVAYYYPITRENANLNGLEVSQCYFIGERNSTRLQSGLWTHGAGIHIDHCVFYNCRNAMVLIKSIKDFSLTNSIIDGAYESAIWYGASDAPFTFRNNIITNCSFFWVRPENTQPAYTFSNSLITNNSGYMGFITNHGLVPATKSNLTEKGIRKRGKISLVQIETDKEQPRNYLNLSPASDGRDLRAGIFKNER